jgi:hypothetical protein
MPHRRSFVNRFATVLTLALALGALPLLGGCRSDGSGDGDAQASASSEAEEAPVKGAVPPADHRMAKLAIGMPIAQVEEIMGAPTDQSRYPTGKSFAPFQFSNDSGWRTEYKYAGEGRVVFAQPRWGGSPQVVRIDYDPAEDGN